MAGNKKIGSKDLVKLLEKWSQDFTVFAPSRENGEVLMREWDGKDSGFLEWYRNSTQPPKDIILPPMEKMFDFHKEKEGYRIEEPPPQQRRRLLFGIRPCDARALTIVDMPFKEGYEDPYYLARRQGTLLVGLSCTRPYDSCFCTSVGGGPSDASGVDVLLTDTGDGYLAEAATPAGGELLDSAGLEDASPADEAGAAEAKKAALAGITRKIDSEGLKDRLLSCFEDREFWEKAAAKCLSCGVCTFFCPTCYCFDINDEMVGEQGARFKSWDSCAFSVYTQMPMENPRLEKWRRVRQKVCHKFEFYPMNFGVFGCVGCGRCIRLCPVNWDITRVLESLPPAAES